MRVSETNNVVLFFCIFSLKFSFLWIFISVILKIISVPGIAERLAFMSLDKSTVFFLFNKRNRDLVDLFLGNNLGGPALIFSRFAEKGNSHCLQLITHCLDLIIIIIYGKLRTHFVFCR